MSAPVLHSRLSVGFGVSTPEHVRLVAELADGVVVASAILKLLEDLAGSGG